MEIRAENAREKLRQSNRTDKRTYNAVTSLLLKRCFPSKSKWLGENW